MSKTRDTNVFGLCKRSHGFEERLCYREDTQSGANHFDLAQTAIHRNAHRARRMLPVAIFTLQH